MKYAPAIAVIARTNPQTPTAMPTFDPVLRGWEEDAELNDMVGIEDENVVTSDDELVLEGDVVEDTVVELETPTVAASVIRSSLSQHVLEFMSPQQNDPSTSHGVNCAGSVSLPFI